MPVFGIYQGNRRHVSEVPFREDTQCPECGGRLRKWREASDGTIPHFKHTDAMGHGEGGRGSSSACITVAESEEHKHWKHLAEAKLRALFGERLEFLGQEYRLEAPVSGKEHRDADVAARFVDRDEQFGEGLAIEVQHKNVSKDIQGTTDDYVAQDFAVAWLDSNDFGRYKCKLDETDLRHRTRQAVWPERVPPRSQWGSAPASYRELMQSRSVDKLLKKYEQGAPATLPLEWHDEQARRIWRTQDWESLFSRSDVPRWILRGLVSTQSHGPLPHPTLPPVFADQMAATLWNAHPWKQKFEPAEDYLSDITEGRSRRTAEVAFAPWFDEETWKRWWRDGAVYHDHKLAEVIVRLNTENASRRCTDCGEPAVYNIIEKELGYNGFYCGDCAEFVTEEEP
ncbi:hypothetical protein [Haloglomus halophilum]|uniref:hypothetical protein n=1 Tax=Haloglomus halophilum TaxID=2962672 RepID=UPI0020C9992A|nr:hypothetical protein [Haloglomus halophilum]